MAGQQLRMARAFPRIALASLWLLACSSPASTDPNSPVDAVATDAGKSDGKSASGKLVLASVTPSRGSLQGGNTIDVAGSGFGLDAEVWFGTKQAEVTFRSGTGHLFCVAPAGDAPGPVDVRVRSGGVEVKLGHGYAWLGEVRIDDFAPMQGSASGGVAITVHGGGFYPGDRLLIGWREAMSSQVIDAHTLTAVVPATALPDGVDQWAVPLAVRHGSGLTTAVGKFTYGRTPRIDAVVPSVVDVDGGPVTIVGRALGNASQLWARGAAGTWAPGTASGSRGAGLPALHALDPNAQPGPADLRVAGAFGSAKLAPAFVYGGPVASPTLWGVAPKTGPSTGGTEAALLLGLPAGAQVTGVQFGGKAAKFSLQDGVLRAVTPAQAVGAVSVVVETSVGSATLPAGFSYAAPVSVAKVTPASGPTAGGTTVQVLGSGFVPGCTVRVGLYFAKVQSIAPTALVVVTPPGAPGAADVQVECGGLVASLAGGFGYDDGGPHLNAVLPSSGAIAGGTPVVVVGSGFTPQTQFLFGGKPAQAVTVLDASHAELQTPAHPAGVVDVSAIRNGQADTLLNGFVYENPGSPNGGTSGEQSLGTLNVTVLNIYTREPIEGAYVQVGQPGAKPFPKYNGTTDAEGMVVFSGTDLNPPLTVSASKAEFSASSIVSFDARNATLLLFPWTPPSSGPGEPPPPLPLAQVRGKVLDLDKYLLVPPSTCLKSGMFEDDRTCDSCALASDCTSTSGWTYQCIASGAAGKLCQRECSTNADCGPGFDCNADAGSAPGTLVCLPSQGIRRVLCSTTVRDWRSESDNPPVGKQPDKSLPWDTVAADMKTGEFTLTTRLDELAIQCIGGYIDNQSKKFVPTGLGVRRHVFPKPGAFCDGYQSCADQLASDPPVAPNPALVWPQNHLDVRLDIQLRRTLHVRLDHPQHMFAGKGGTLSVVPWLDLGSDGLVQLPRLAPADAVSDNPELSFQPVQLPAAWTDTDYTYLASVDFAPGPDNDPSTPPLTATLHPNVVAPGDANLRLRLPTGQTVDSALGVDVELTGVLAAADGTLLVQARNGRLWQGQPGKLKTAWIPPILDPYLAPVQMYAAAGAPSNATLVGEGGTIRRWSNGAMTTETGVLKGDLRGVCVAPSARVAVGAQGIQVDLGQGWQLATATPGWRAVVCTPDGAVAVGDDGKLARISGKQAIETAVANVALRTVVRLPNGEVWLGGDKPKGDAAVLLKCVGAVCQPGWPAGTVGTPWPALRTLVPLAQGGLLLADVEGGVRRLDAAGVHDESPLRRDLHVTAGVLLTDGRTVLVGQPGLWLGPFLTVPQVTAPTTIKSTGSHTLTWQMAPGPLGSCARIHLNGNGFPFWWLYVAPDLTSVSLPDFASLAGINVFPSSPNMKLTWVMRIDRVYVPDFSMDGFQTLEQIEQGDWRSWSTNTRQMQ
jgi:hypothetical protein